MKKEIFSKVRLYSSIAILGIVSLFLPCVNAQETSSYTPAKLESDGVVSRYEIKTVLKYYDKVTGFSVNPDEITDKDSYKVVEEKQLIPHFYSVVPSFNKLSNESADTGVKYYQWGKSASTSHLLYEVSDKKYSDLTVFYTPSKNVMQKEEQKAESFANEQENSVQEVISEISTAQTTKVEKLSRQEKKDLKAEIKLQKQQNKAKFEAEKELKIQEKKVLAEEIKNQKNQQKEEIKVKKILAKEKRKLSESSNKTDFPIKPKENNAEVSKVLDKQNDYTSETKNYKVYQEQKVNDKATVSLKNKALNLLIPFQLRRQAPSGDKKIIKNLSDEGRYRNTSRTSNVGVLK